MSHRRPPGKSASDSRAIIKKGAQGVRDRGKNAKETAVVLPSTQRAIQLRNGKGGSFGTGEMVRIAGREKLELIAEDEMERAKEERTRNLYEGPANIHSSIKAPFKLEMILKIAQSQMDAYIDRINALHKSELCYDFINREIQAQCPPRKTAGDPESMLIPSFVAEQFGICVHNTHMLASGWVLVYESFKKMQEIGLTDNEVLAQLKSGSKFRPIYLAAYELLKKLVFAGQQRLRSIAQNTPHYSQYFKASDTAKDFQEFEKLEVRKMYKSFFDSAIVELCLPGSKFSPQALYFCLHLSGEETPKESKRCTQVMWDAVGDLSEAVRLMDIVEAPLLVQGFDLSPEDSSIIFNEYALWDEAQPVSIRAAIQYSGFVNLVNPLTNLKNQPTLDKTWERINANYVRETGGKNIDALWQLVDVKKRIPHFSTFNIPEEFIFDEPENGNNALVRHNRNGNSGRRKALAITENGEEENSDSSMPGLLAVSDSEEDPVYTESDSESDSPNGSSDESSDDDDEEYDSDEDGLKRLERDAMTLLHQDPAYLDNNDDTYANSRKTNSLLQLLANLKGRLFSSSSALRTDGNTTATTRPSGAKPQAKKTGSRASTIPKPAPSGQAGQSTRTTVEDADDESDEQKGDKKKKKKPKKKKKKSTMDSVSSPTVEDAPSPVTEPPRSMSPIPINEAASPTPPASPKGKKSSAKSAPSRTPSITSTLTGTTAYESTTTIHHLPTEQKAPSAHSYRQQLGETKVKVKTRPDQPIEEEERVGLFERFRGKAPPKEDIKAQKNNAVVFGNLKKKTGNFARRLFGVSAQDKKGALKWEQFLQIMRELGFEYDPSTAGSSVRFDPPNGTDRAITFHKPHPDPTLHQNKLKEYRDKLEAYYGWSPERFQKAMDGIGGMTSEEEEID